MNYYGFDINSVYVDPRNGEEYYGGLFGDKNPRLGYVFFVGFWKFEIKTVLGKAHNEGKFGRVDTSFASKILNFIGISIKVFPIVLSVIVAYCLFFNYLTYHEVGLAKNLITKNVYIQDKAGMYITSPWIFVVRVDTRPIRVSVHSSTRSASSKLVQFVPEYWEEFVKNEGWRYYWWSNRISFNLSYPEEYRGWRDVARGYAYSAKSYPFFKVIEEYGETK